MPLISVVTPLFPIPEEPYRGKAIYQTVLSLQRYADVEVFCPIAVYPPFLRPRYRYHRTDLTYRPPGIDRICYFEYRVVPVLSRPFNGRFCSRLLYPHLKESRSSLILSYWLYPEGYSSLQVGQRLGRPVIVSSRGSDLRRIEDSVTRRLVSATVRNADYVLTVSQELRQQALALGADPARTRSIPNGCDPAVFHYSPALESRGLLGIDSEQRVILFAGWLAPSKGVVELLHAFHKLALEDHNLRLVCIGEGSYSGQMLDFAAQHRLQDRILLTGKRSAAEVAQWMNAADVFCLPSHSEGCPSVVVEAIACGTPVVATDVGGIPELVTGECGMLVPPHDAGRLSQELRNALLRSWDRREIARLSQRGWDQVAAETYAVCLEVLKTRPGY